MSCTVQIWDETEHAQIYDHVENVDGPSSHFPYWRIETLDEAATQIIYVRDDKVTKVTIIAPTEEEVEIPDGSVSQNQMPSMLS